MQYSKTLLSSFRCVCAFVSPAVETYIARQALRWYYVESRSSFCLHSRIHVFSFFSPCPIFAQLRKCYIAGLCLGYMKLNVRHVYWLVVHIYSHCVGGDVFLLAKSFALFCSFCCSLLKPLGHFCCVVKCSFHLRRWISIQRMKFTHS